MRAGSQTAEPVRNRVRAAEGIDVALLRAAARRVGTDEDRGDRRVAGPAGIGNGELARLGHGQLLSVALLVRLRDPVGDLAHACELAARGLPARPGRCFGGRGPGRENDERTDACADDRGESEIDDPEAEAVRGLAGPVAARRRELKRGLRLGRRWRRDHILGHVSSCSRSISGFLRPTPSRIRIRSSPKTSRRSTSVSAIFSTASLFSRTRL